MDELIITKPNDFSPGTLCRVLSTTDKRYKVEVVKSLDSIPTNVNNYWAKPYVNKDSIMIFNATEEQYQLYLRLWVWRVDSIRTLTATINDDFNYSINKIFE